MIECTYIFLEGIKKRMERRIWQQGISNWDSFIKKNRVKGISKLRKEYYNRKLLEAKKELYNLNSSYFLSLPSSETWRLYDFFKEESIFLDIETSGMSKFSDITIIGLFDGLKTKTMINGINFDYNSLKKELSKYKLMVTFNGAIFDIPFIKKRYPFLLPRIPNFDLRFACRRLGLSGGLKEIEKKLGIKRRKEVEEMYGYDALLLWETFKRTKDEYYLNLLVEYNEEDTFNLKKIADYVYKELKKQTFENEYKKS